VVRGVILAECGPGTNYTIDSELVTNFASKNPFFIPFGSINPNYHNVMHEFLHSLSCGVHGFKFYPADHSFDPSIKEMMQVYKECEKYQLPIIFHTGLTSQRDASERFINPNCFKFIAEKYPDLKIILAHAGKPYWYNEAIKIVQEYPNVFIDTALIGCSDLEKICTNYSDIIDKILFGSDWPVVGSYTDLINSYLQIKISQSMLENIMFNNANKLLRHIS
jgi:hypothetical protein